MTRDVKRLHVRSDVLRALASGQLRPGDKLPSEKTLEREYGYSRNTIRDAIGELCHRDLLWRDRPRGTFVRPDALKNLRELEGSDWADPPPDNALARQPSPQYRLDEPRDGPRQVSVFDGDRYVVRKPDKTEIDKYRLPRTEPIGEVLRIDGRVEIYRAYRTTIVSQQVPPPTA